jgi:DNA-binding response OmpR family regulator
VSSLTVLVVEDERHIRDLVCLHLGLEGFECVAVGDGLEAVQLSAARAFDLVVLDLMLPGLDGIGVCRAIRREGMNGDVPILMLTARREEADKVLGLESGADDYLTKPFGIRELVARARALTRRPRAAAGATRPESPSAERPLAVGDIEIDPSRRRVQVRGGSVELTPHEFTLLYVLASHPGIVYTREALLAKIWRGEVHVTTRSVDTLVKRLRQKIERDQSGPEYILTVWGMGYKFNDQKSEMGK